jgi:acyl-CoA thioesterase
MTSPEELAEAAAAAMFANDRNAHAMGMVVTSIGPGRATVEMTVTEHMTNGFDVCHGGVIFTLADTAMAFASNSRGGTHLAAHANIEWLAPARRGDQLRAEANEIHLRGRSAVFDITVHGPDGVIALFRGQTRKIADDGPAS